MPWRNIDNPYYVYVSEIMLQQTQVSRVLDKYQPFINAFSRFDHLASSSIQSIYEVWQGLGYNRRVVNMQETAQIVIEGHNGVLPRDLIQLNKLPGVGKATASAIMAFAFNEPAVFVETNIRNVYLYYFFQGKSNVNDNDILKVIDLTRDRNNPRQWYYALMDYGAMLKKLYPALNKKSSHYSVQSPFQGSDRQIRGRILSYLCTDNDNRGYADQQKSVSETYLLKKLQVDRTRGQKILARLCKEGFIKYTAEKIVVC